MSRHRQRLDEILAPLAEELEEWMEWYDSLSPEQQAAERAWNAAQIQPMGPCVQGPRSKGGNRGNA